MSFTLENQKMTLDKLLRAQFCTWKPLMKALETESTFFFISLKSWNTNEIETVQKNERFVLIKMQPTKKRPVYSTSCIYKWDDTVCSYAVVLVSFLYMSGKVKNDNLRKQRLFNIIIRPNVDLIWWLNAWWVHCKTPMAFLNNMIDFADWAHIM